MTGFFKIDGKLPGINEMINAARTHWAQSAKQKKEETARCQWAVIAGNLPKFNSPVTIHFDWFEPNARRDIGNIRAGEKYISDALVALGKIPNDNLQWVKGMSDSFYVDRVNPRIEVTIKPVLDLPDDLPPTIGA